MEKENFKRVCELIQGDVFIPSGFVRAYKVVSVNDTHVRAMAEPTENCWNRTEVLLGKKSKQLIKFYGNKK